jgi:hypothetical protein
MSEHGTKAGFPTSSVLQWERAGSVRENSLFRHTDFFIFLVWLLQVKSIEGYGMMSIIKPQEIHGPIQATNHQASNHENRYISARFVVVSF